MYSIPLGYSRDKTYVSCWDLWLTVESRTYVLYEHDGVIGQKSEIIYSLIVLLAWYTWGLFY